MKLMQHVYLLQLKVVVTMFIRLAHPRLLSEATLLEDCQ